MREWMETSRLWSLVGKETLWSSNARWSDHVEVDAWYFWCCIGSSLRGSSFCSEGFRVLAQISFMGCPWSSGDSWVLRIRKAGFLKKSVMTDCLWPP